MSTLFFIDFGQLENVLKTKSAEATNKSVYEGMTLSYTVNSFSLLNLFWLDCNDIGGVIVSVFTLSAVERGFELQCQWSQIKDYAIGMCGFSAKQEAEEKKTSKNKE